MLHQAWSDGMFFAIINHEARRRLASGATVVWQVNADSWGEAFKCYLEWRGEPIPEMAVWKHFPSPDSEDEEALARELIAKGEA